jgi:CubicO group peptidase (beta-lactamase class C family)
MKPSWTQAWRRATRASLSIGLAAAAWGASSPAAWALPPQLFKPEWVLPTVPVSGPRSGQAPERLVWPAAPRDLSALRYEWAGQRLSLEDFQSRGKVKALLVLQDGKVVYEHHRWPNGPTTLHQSWSMMKQVLSALVGMAIQQGRIASVDEPMDRYAPQLAANGFKGVTFRQALMMSAGIRYNEEVDRVSMFKQLIAHRFTAGLAGHTLDEKVTEAALDRVYEPGSRHQYASIVSQALALALEGAQGQPLHRILSRDIWTPLGMPDDARLLTDDQGRDLGLCCLYATARSYAAFGQWYMQGGMWRGQPLLNAQWVQDSTTFAPGKAWRSNHVPRPVKTQELMGFGYHWWPLEGGRDDFIALGIQGQMIHVSPRHGVVTVRLSDDVSAGYHNEEAVTMARAVADFLKPPR